jgi:hypothetical protein
MTVSFRGNITVGGAVSGLSLNFQTVSNALLSLKATVDAQLTALASVIASINGQISALAAAKIAIRIPAVADFQAQLDGAIAANLNLTADISNPALYISGLLNGLAELQVIIPSLVPSVALTAQIDASASLEIAMTAKIAEVDLQLAALVTIGIALTAIANIVAAIQTAFNAAIQAILGALALTISVPGLLAAGGIGCFLYVGPLSGLGTAIDLVASTDTGIPGATNVRVPVLVYDDANTPGKVGMQSVFGTDGA